MNGRDFVSLMQLVLSTMVISFLIQFAMTFAILILAVRMIIFKNRFLRRLLGGPQIAGQSWGDNAVLIISNLPLIGLYFPRSVSDEWDSATHCFRYLLMNFFLWSYFEALAVLSHRSRTLLLALPNSTTWPNLDSLIAQRWLIREAVAELNALYGPPLALVHVQILAGGLSVFAFILVDPFLKTVPLVIVTHVARHLLLFEMARRTSALKKLLVDFETELLLRYGGAVPPFCIDGFDNARMCSLLQWQSLRFVDRRDSPRVGCFVNGVPAFMSFLATGVTLLAILSQFDFRLVHKVGQLSAEFGPGPLAVDL